MVKEELELPLQWLSLVKLIILVMKREWGLTSHLVLCQDPARALWFTGMVGETLSCGGSLGLEL